MLLQLCHLSFKDWIKFKRCDVEYILNSNSLRLYLYLRKRYKDKKILPRSLQCILNHVEKYAFTWRLHNNPSDSVFVFNKANTCFVSHSIKLFRSHIPQSERTVYNWCLLQSNMESDKFKFVSLKLLKRVVLPFTSYSCKIWPSLTISDIQMLEYIQKYISSIIQGVSKFFFVSFKPFNIALWTIQGYLDKWHRSDQTSLHNNVYRVISGYIPLTTIKIGSTTK